MGTVLLPFLDFSFELSGHHVLSDSLGLVDTGCRKKWDDLETGLLVLVVLTLSMYLQVWPPRMADFLHCIFMISVMFVSITIVIIIRHSHILVVDQMCGTTLSVCALNLHDQ